jgi:hypothetical protein
MSEGEISKNNGDADFDDWLNKFSGRVENEMEKSEEGRDLGPENNQFLEEISDNLIKEASYQEALTAIKEKYNTLPEDQKVAFLAKTSQLIEDYKGRGDSRLTGQVEAYIDFLESLMNERG